MPAKGLREQLTACVNDFGGSGEGPMHVTRVVPMKIYESHVHQQRVLVPIASRFGLGSRVCSKTRISEGTSRASPPYLAAHIS